MHPLDTACWLLRRAYDDYHGPFYLYETMVDGISLRSLANLISNQANPVYRTYHDAKLFSAEPNTPEDFNERQTRIFDIASEFRLSKVLPNLSGGAFSAKNMFLDISTKSIQYQEFNYDKEFVSQETMNGYSVLSKSFQIPYELPNQKVKLSEAYDSYAEYVPTNGLAYSADQSIKNYHDLLVDNGGKYNSVVETLDTIVHDITVAGDFNLSSGKKVELQIPKSIDPAKFDSTTLNGRFDEVYDRTISGKYLITAITHTFAEEYYCKLRLKRDSFTYDVNKD
jgi:hypothetical protein